MYKQRLEYVCIYRFSLLESISGMYVQCRFVDGRNVYLATRYCLGSKASPISEILSFLERNSSVTPTTETLLSPSCLPGQK